MLENYQMTFQTVPVDVKVRKSQNCGFLKQSKKKQRNIFLMDLKWVKSKKLKSYYCSNYVLINIHILSLSTDPWTPKSGFCLVIVLIAQKNDYITAGFGVQIIVLLKLCHLYKVPIYF